MTNRISWDNYWIQIAKNIALRSTCIRRQIGAIIVKDNILISSGYNGAPSGFPHCIDIGCIRNKNSIPAGEQYELCCAVHAEQNALLRSGLNSNGATMYVNEYPCTICARLMINAGIKRVVVIGNHPKENGLELLREAGIQIDLINNV